MLRGSLLPAAVVLALLVAAGCRSNDPAPTPTATQVASALVPWSDAVPQELVVPEGPPAKACKAKQLQVIGTGFFLQPVGTGGRGRAAFRNVGAAPCRLTGRPVVRFVGAPKAPRQEQVGLPAQPPTFPEVVPPVEALLALAPGSAAILEIDWSNWCVPDARSVTGPLVPPRAVRVTLPGSRGFLDVDYNAVAPCLALDKPSTIGVTPFQPAPLEAEQAWTSGALEARILTVDGKEEPVAGRRGEEVRYAVELKNTSTDTTVTFETCPTVIQLLAPEGRSEVHLLNCADADPIGPGQSERFEMRIRVPDDAPSGPNGLFWELDPRGSQAPEVVGRLVVSD